MQSELHSNLIQTVYETELVYVYEDAKISRGSGFAYLSKLRCTDSEAGVEKCVNIVVPCWKSRIRRRGDCWRCGKSKRVISR